MDRLALHEGVAAAFDIITAANGFVAERAPWALAKDPQNAAQLDAVLFEVSEAVRAAATLLLPVMPTSANELLRRLRRHDAAGRPTPGPRRRLAQRRRPRRSIAGPALWPRTDLAGPDAPANVTTKKETAVDETAPAPKAPAGARRRRARHPNAGTGAGAAGRPRTPASPSTTS